MQQAAFFLGTLFFEQCLRILREFENQNTEIHVRPISLPVQFDFPRAFVLFVAPLARRFEKECFIDTAIQLVRVNGMQASFQPVMFGLQAIHCLSMLLLLIGVAGPQRGRYPFKHAVGDADAAHGLGKLFLKPLFANILLRAFTLAACAVIIDVLAFFQFADHGASAMAASEDAGKGEASPRMLELSGVAFIQHSLNTLPQVARHKRFMAAAAPFAEPIEIAGVNAVAQDVVDTCSADGPAGVAIHQTSSLPPQGQHFDGYSTRRIPGKQAGYDRADNRVNIDDTSPVRSADIDVANRGTGGPQTLTDLLADPLANLFRKIVDILLGHHDADGVHEFLG